MDTNKQDTASEPVETQDDEFMDTGVLHEKPKKVKESDASDD